MAVIASARLVASLVSASRSGVPGVDEGCAWHVQAHDFHQHLGWSWLCRRRCRCRVRGKTWIQLPRVPRVRFCLGVQRRWRAFSSFGRPDVIGPAGTKIDGKWPNESAPITNPGMILSQTPKYMAASNMLCESPMAAAWLSHRVKSARVPFLSVLE